MVSQYLPPFANEEVKSAFQDYVRIRENYARALQRETSLKQSIQLLENKVVVQAEEIHNSNNFVCEASISDT
jgi:hypothetical protein